MNIRNQRKLTLRFDTFKSASVFFVGNSDANDVASGKMQPTYLFDRRVHVVRFGKRHRLNGYFGIAADRHVADKNLFGWVAFYRLSTMKTSKRSLLVY